MKDKETIMKELCKQYVDMANEAGFNALEIIETLLAAVYATARCCKADITLLMPLVFRILSDYDNQHKKADGEQPHEEI